MLDGGGGGAGKGATGEGDEGGGGALLKFVRIPVSVAFKQYASHSSALLNVFTPLVSTMPLTSPKYCMPAASAPFSLPNLKQ